jgi:5-methylcytosine-specific restriction endonuclease McrA
MNSYVNGGCRCGPCTVAKREYLRSQRARSHEGYNAYMAKYLREHPEVRHIRRARKAGVAHLPYKRADIFERDEGVCHICSETVDPEQWDLDHVVPISRGGGDTPENVAVSHPSCNRSKGARALDTHTTV